MITRSSGQRGRSHFSLFGKILCSFVGTLGIANALHAACIELGPGINPSGSSLVLTNTPEDYIPNKEYCIEQAYVNAGSLRNEVRLTNNGVLTNTNLLTDDASLINNGIINNSANATLWIAWPHTMTSYGRINNAGNINGSLYNYGVINNSGELGSSDGFGNYGVINNSGHIGLHHMMSLSLGVINNSADGILDISNSIFSGTINNKGLLHVHGGFASGTLKVSGGITSFSSLIGANAIEVAGGTFQGTGDVRAPVTVDGGRISAGGGWPGDTFGAMDIYGEMNFKSGTLLTELGFLGSDVINVNGSANFLSGNFLFSFLDGYQPNGTTSWMFLSATNGIFGWENLSVRVSGLSGRYDYFVSGNSNQLYLNVAAVPEPETYGMLLAGLTILSAIARRRRS